MPSTDLTPRKVCKTCEELKPLLDFPARSSSPDGHFWHCFDCKRARDREYGRRYRERHPEQKRQNARKYARTDEARQLRSALSLKAKYGLTPAAFEEKLAAQGGRCPFCPEDTEVTKWDVDHDHLCCEGSQTCGKCLRDLLCHKHNVGLGYWDDDPDALRRAADYIEQWRKVIRPELKAERPIPRPRTDLQRKTPTFLTAEQMEQVRSEYGKSGITQKQLAERFGVSQATISNVLTYGRSTAAQ
jgi:predicted DNA-binding protein (UPF0251 family)